MLRTLFHPGGGGPLPIHFFGAGAVSFHAAFGAPPKCWLLAAARFAAALRALSTAISSSVSGSGSGSSVYESCWRALWLGETLRYDSICSSRVKWRTPPGGELKRFISSFGRCDAGR